MKLNETGRMQRRRDRLIREMVHDSYKSKTKPPEPTVCPTCNAIYHEGRWQWAESWPYAAHKQMCPACHRSKDRYPAGVITLRGRFALARKKELIQLAQHHEQKENAEHPPHRIMRIEEHADAIVIETTDIHLPCRIADALRHGYKGHLQMHYDQEGYHVRVNWSAH